MNLAEAGSVLAYRGGWRAVRYLPDAAAYRAFHRVADLAWRRRTTRAQRLRANLARVRRDAPSSELDALTRDGLRSYLTYWCDVFRLPDWTPDRIVGQMRVDDEANLRDALAAGTGLVAGLPHMGNWDHAGAWATLTGVDVTTVAERLRPEAVYRDFVAFREGLGMHILPLTGGDVDLLAALADAVRANHLVPLLADRDLTARGVPVTFFGERATMPAGPAALALRTGTPLSAVTLWYEGVPPHHTAVMRFGEPMEMPTDRTTDWIPALTQKLADEFERRIREHPADWHMLATLFTDDLVPR